MRRPAASGLLATSAVILACSGGDPLPAGEARRFARDLARGAAQAANDPAPQATTRAMARACFASPTCAGACGLTLLDLGHAIWPRPSHACADLGGDPRDVETLSRRLAGRIRDTARVAAGHLPRAERDRLDCALGRLLDGAAPAACPRADAETAAAALADLAGWSGSFLLTEGEIAALKDAGPAARKAAICARVPGCGGRCGRTLELPLHASPAQIEALLRDRDRPGVARDCPEAAAALAADPDRRGARQALIQWGAERAARYASAGRGPTTTPPPGPDPSPAPPRQPASEWPPLEVTPGQAQEHTRSLRAESDRRAPDGRLDGTELRRFAAACAIDASCAADCGLGLFYYYYFPGPQTPPLPGACGPLGGDPTDRARIERGVLRRQQQWWQKARPLVAEAWRQHVDCALGRLGLAPAAGEACAFADEDRLADQAVQSLAGARWDRASALARLASDCANTPSCVGRCGAVFDALAAGERGRRLREITEASAGGCPAAAQAVARLPDPRALPGLIDWAGQRTVEHLLAGRRLTPDRARQVRCAFGHAGLAPTDLRACPDRKALARVH